jgi:hypothetical protein
MIPVQFKQLPLLVRIAVGVVFYNAWPTEEFVRPSWPVEIHAVLQSGRPLYLGLGRRHDHNVGHMARLSSADTTHGALTSAALTVCSAWATSTRPLVPAGSALFAVQEATE